MDTVSNRILFAEKIQSLNLFKNTFKSELFPHTIACNYHGIGLKFYSQNDKLSQSLLSFIPASWIKTNDEIYEIYVLNPSYFNCNLENWTDETSQDCYSLENNDQAVQRDFAASFISKKEILLICEDIVGDGFHNFLRWFITERLIANDKYVVHASCVLDKKNLAHIFLGHSGAGKTTITKLSAPRLTLGDDMNIITFNNHDLMVEAGAIGGLFNSMIGYDKAIKVKAFYWLHQSNENQLQKLSTTAGHQKLLASFANLNWPTLPAETADKLVDFSFKVTSVVDFYELNFKKDASVWEMLDP